MQQILSQCLDQAGITTTPQQFQQLHRLLVLLLDHNQRVNLTAVRDYPTAACKHIADSLLPLTLPALQASPADQPLTVLDLGCGAGFPGLPLAIMRPCWQLTEMDATQKKLQIVQLMADDLGLTNLKTLHARAETAAHSPLREQFDRVAARAVAALPILCEYALPLVKPGGQAWLYKGPEAEQEALAAGAMAGQLGAAPAQITPYALPNQDRRALVVYDKRRPTPPAFPRANAAIRGGKAR